MCHTIVAQGPTGAIKAGAINEALEFVHPIEIKGAWKEYFCTECHRVLY
jgi:hypothetical protein